ncbi:hypothetical protein Desor_2296 [Desulfosporosinus orientis DSM 765]|uniref:Uncharacterized protein n=1 Tax=Desulfosporosinus orientis (strain ATCC 19365 / DSM 765 / NCIMB 8382 / VKM B-1628 / Singapore I) TaxID=768706 RepID=G7WBB1_DESOD|nr:hypothetical protein [Desulfosporosinus orientis]AET67892.1 hypothetical protein Desor_2296 [Desulfosporosinus orientis DSM 765]
MNYINNSRQPRKGNSVVLKNHLITHRANSSQNNNVKINQDSLNKLSISLPLEGFRIQLTAPLFSIEAFSPADITLIAITPNEFYTLIVTPKGVLETLVSSLVLEVFNPDGVMIFKIVAPPI